MVFFFVLSPIFLLMLDSSKFFFFCFTASFLKEPALYFFLLSNLLISISIFNKSSFLKYLCSTLTFVDDSAGRIPVQKICFFHKDIKMPLFHYNNEIKLFTLATCVIPSDVKYVRESYFQTSMIGMHVDTAILAGNLAICMKSLSGYAFQQTILLLAIYA